MPQRSERGKDGESHVKSDITTAWGSWQISDSASADRTIFSNANAHAHLMVHDIGTHGRHAITDILS